MNKALNAIETTEQFSTLEVSPVKGTLLGTILLLCGSSIGVGILPLPILTGAAGALPTFLAFLACSVYMTITALLILESSLTIPGASFISISKRLLNRYGQLAVIFSFLFLFYSLTVAYLAKGGELTQKVLTAHSSVPIPECSGALILALLSGALVLFGPFVVDHLNRIFMLGFIVTYALLGNSGLTLSNMDNLRHYNWSHLVLIIPFVVTSFGYHNLVPFAGNYLDQNRKKSIQAFIFAGMLLFLIYVIWTLGLHSIIPLEGSISISDSFSKGEIVTEPLARLIQSPFILHTTVYMAFFAIITSILGQGLSVIDFLAEWTGFRKTFHKRAILCCMLFAPTFLLSQLIPGVFFKALEFAGGVAAMILFGVIPAVLGWKQRFKMKDPLFKSIVPGGKWMLLFVMAFALFIIFYEISVNVFRWRVF